ncbi:MAG: aminomethyl-transferring glycine dehydrogenase subunit GcvPA [Candidatus Lokiarchaeota archaeon]|nr:aminomethyl-transferring glycine dehydrogenase subunit GcvPA [Candidatus Lokiarchaeota archaeon]MBD3199478.1 aminomethyl-transferring glycine dehydrogenase subunit GcvPA [Candidatus Lokiarchaeota archaeon]
MDFIPHDKKVIKEILNTIGVESIDALFSDIPNEIKIDKLEIDDGLFESDLYNEMHKLSLKNGLYSSSFLGAGCYYHYIPSSVESILSRSEFYTSYTPYQAEASQGNLQAIYEYQTLITRLTEMDISNASMYDGSTALAEAALISTVITRNNRILILEGLHPEYLEVLKTYCWAQDIELEFCTEEEIANKINDDYASLIFQNPNFFGEIEDTGKLINQARNKTSKPLIIECMTDPTCLGILKPPGAYDIDIFVAEGQSFGIPPSFGGPGLGIYTTKKKYLRKTPGRLVGKTKELYGDKIGYILTLQTREQHIRREKAISNICTNEALMALASLIYLVSLGSKGLKKVAYNNIQKSNYVKRKIDKLNNFSVLNQKPTYNEFLIKSPNIDRFLDLCEQDNLLAPLKISIYYPEMENTALVCITEENSIEDIQLFLENAQKCV